MKYSELEKMVREVNATQVDVKDQLSDHVYHYDAKEKVFELAEKFDARKKEKTAEKPALGRRSHRRSLPAAGSPGGKHLQLQFVL